MYNWYEYKNAWTNFLYVRPTTNTWFVKYCPEVATSIIPRWFYEWWSYFGGTEQVMPKQFANKYPQFQINEGISTLPENIKLCKYFIKKRLSYIISWTFVIADFDWIKFLSKEIRFICWSQLKRKATLILVCVCIVNPSTYPFVI